VKVNLVIWAVVALVIVLALAACGVSVNLSAGPDADGKLVQAQAGATATVQAANAIATRSALENQDKAKVDEGTRDFRTAQGNVLAGALAGGLGILLLVGLPIAGFLTGAYVLFVVRRKARQPSAAKSGPWTIATVPGLPSGGVVLHDDQPVVVTFVGADVPGTVFAPLDPSVAIAASQSRAAIGAGNPGGLERIQRALAAMHAFNNQTAPRSLPASTNQSK
jgi:hypothetical protein